MFVEMEFFWTARQSRSNPSGKEKLWVLCGLSPTDWDTGSQSQLRCWEQFSMYNDTMVLNGARYSTADIKLEHQHTVRQSNRSDYTVRNTELMNESWRRWRRATAPGREREMWPTTCSSLCQEGWKRWQGHRREQDRESETATKKTLECF